jgi:hypothetical protein
MEGMEIKQEFNQGGRMKRKTLILACSVMMIVAVLTTSILTGCTASTVTSTVTGAPVTSTKTATVTSTVTGPAGTTATVTNTVTNTTTATAPPSTVTQTVQVSGTATLTPITSTITTTRSTTVTSSVVSTVVSTVVNTVTATGGLITVLNPTVENTMVAREPLPARFTTLAGKKVYMIDILWGGPDGARQIYDTMETWFKANSPTTTIVRKTKRGSYGTDDPDLWKLVAADGAAAIIGISG